MSPNSLDVWTESDSFEVDVVSSCRGDVSCDHSVVSRCSGRISAEIPSSFNRVSQVFAEEGILEVGSHIRTIFFGAGVDSCRSLSSVSRRQNSIASPSCSPKGRTSRYMCSPSSVLSRFSLNCFQSMPDLPFPLGLRIIRSRSQGTVCRSPELVLPFVRDKKLAPESNRRQ